MKLVALAILASLLSHIHFSAQPRIEALMSQVKADAPVPDGSAPKIAAFHSKRKKVSGVCFFLVLTALIMGLRATFFYGYFLPIGLIIVAAVYACRVYRKPVPPGWVWPTTTQPTQRTERLDLLAEDKNSTGEPQAGKDTGESRGRGQGAKTAMVY